MSTHSNLMNLVQPQPGKMRQISSQGRQEPPAIMAAAIPFETSIVVDMDHGYTNQVQTDYSSVAYWYQTEPHTVFPALPPLEDRLPTPAGQNQAQFALLTSPLWLPAAALGLKALRRLLGRRANRDA